MSDNNDMGASADADRATAASQSSPQAVSSIAGIPSAEALAQLLYDYTNIRSSDFCAKYPAFVAARDDRKRRFKETGHEAGFEIVIAIGESLAVGNADAPNSQEGD